MAGEAQISLSVTIKKGNLEYLSRPTSFKADISSAKAPSPGGMTVSTTGNNVDLSHLTRPGLCLVQNLDPTNFVTVGVWDTADSEFYPLMDVLPGEVYPMRLSQFLGKELGGGTGTGSIGGTTALRIKANKASCEVKVDCFET